LPQGGGVKAIAGTATIAGKSSAGSINSGVSRLSTDPLYLDVQPAAGTAFEYTIIGHVERRDLRCPWGRRTH